MGRLDHGSSNRMSPLLPFAMVQIPLLTLPPQIGGIGLTVTTVLANTLYGWNHHIWDLHISELMTARKVSLVAQVLYLVASSLAKISILLSYLILAPPETYFRSLSQVAIVIIALVSTTFFVLLFTQCIPTSSYWDILRVNQDCHLREGHFLMAQAVFSVLADLALWVLPLPTFYYARLPLSQRVALIVLFSFGAVVVIAACMRTYWLWWAVGVTWDVTWECRNEWIWTAVEVHLGIICGCVPWMKSLVKMWRKREDRRTLRIGSGRDTVTGGPRKVPSCSVAVDRKDKYGLEVELSDRDSDGIGLEPRASFAGGTMYLSDSSAPEVRHG
jgi:hypothetical protein